MTNETNSAKPSAANPNSAVAICIPARLESSRLPRKLLLAETGKPLIQHTYERAAAAAEQFGLRPPVVVTDSEEIAAAVLEFGGHCHVGPPAESGTERIARYAKHSDAKYFVNVQGDEPEIEPESIGVLAKSIIASRSNEIATLAAPLAAGELGDCNCVKVACNVHMNAMYFTRAPIQAAFRHIGAYAFTRDALAKTKRLGDCEAERAESLEQLRWLYRCMEIAVVCVRNYGGGIDTPEDYREFVKSYRYSQSPDSSIKELCE